MRTTLALCLLTLFSGALIPVQAAANTAFSRSIGVNIPYTAMTVFLTAAVAGLIGILLTGAPRPTIAAFSAAPWWSYLSGAILLFYIYVITFVAPRLGVGTAIALIVTGQILAALTIDHFGLMRALVFPMTAARAIGGAMMILGAFIALRR
jgi:transporter family-2 protein